MKAKALRRDHGDPTKKRERRRLHDGKKERKKKNDSGATLRGKTTKKGKLEVVDGWSTKQDKGRREPQDLTDSEMNTTKLMKLSRAGRNVAWIGELARSNGLENGDGVADEVVT